MRCIFSQPARLVNADLKIGSSSTVARHSSAQKAAADWRSPVMINGRCRCPQETSAQRFLHILAIATSGVDVSQQWIPANIFFFFLPPSVLHNSPPRLCQHIGSEAPETDARAGLPAAGEL